MRRSAMRYAMATAAATAALLSSTNAAQAAQMPNSRCLVNFLCYSYIGTDGVGVLQAASGRCVNFYRPMNNFWNRSNIQATLHWGSSCSGLTSELPPGASKNGDIGYQSVRFG